MARPAASEETRIRRLRDALSRAKSENMIGETIGQGPMCDLLGTNPATLRSWLDDEEVSASGAFIRGGQGVNYLFNPIATIWVLIRYFERLRDQKVAENSRIREMVAGDKLAEAPPEMTVRDVRDAMRLNLDLIAAEKEQGLLVDAAASRATFQELALSMRDTLLSAPQRLDPENAWKPEFREKFDNALADCLVLLRADGREALIDDAILPGSADGEGEVPRKRRAPRKPKKAGTRRA